MMKKIIILLLLTNIGSVNGMDESQPNEDKPCYLAQLPLEILDTIAYYVSIESDEELVARTKKLRKKKISQEYNEHFPAFFKRDSHSILSGFSANGKHVALLNLLYGDNALPELLIVSTETKKMVRNEKLSALTYQHIAISNCGTLVGTIYEQRKWETSYAHLNDSVNRITHRLTIQNLTNKELQEYSLNDFFWINDHYPNFSCDFNKEKNKIVIHADGFEQKKTGTTEDVVHKRHHTIIPLTINTPHAEPVKKTFDHFCKDKWVCRQFTLTYKGKPEQ